MRKANNQLPGKLVVFEGPDGVGKSTISTAIAAHLLTRGEPVVHLTFPGRESGTLGKLVYDLHHNLARFGVASITPSSLQALHIAAHLDILERVILPALREGRHVLLDRFWWSTWVYGIVGGIDRRVLQRLIDVEIAQWETVQPALLVVLRRNAPIDRDHDIREWLALRAEYDALAHKEQDRYPVLVVDNTLPLDETVTKVAAEVHQRLVPSLPNPPEEREEPNPPDSQLVLELDDEPTVPEKPAGDPATIARIAPARPSAVYDTLWRFAAERQAIFFRRLDGRMPPWTGDSVLRRYKFTNVYRASDRVSQYLIRNVIYRADLPTSNEEICFRIVLFKLFNKIETWELLERLLGNITYEEYQFDRYDAVLTDALRVGNRIYSAAYIMPPGHRAFGEVVKHRNHLRLIELMMGDELPKRLADARSMQRGFELLRAYPTVGDFLAYQIITDINYSEVTDFTEMEFVVPGPGSLDGISKCFLNLGGLNEPEIIRLMADRQAEEFARLGLEFRSLWGRPLQLIDCQNLLCEVSKYARVVHPEIAGKSGRTRIKQRFVPGAAPIRYWYPPKWGINDAVEVMQTRTQADQ